MPEPSNRLETWSKIAQILSVLVGVVAGIIGVVSSVQSFNDARKHEARAAEKEAETRRVEAQARIVEAQKYADQRADEARRQRIEAAKPFLQMRQERYLEIVKAAGLLANRPGSTDPEYKEAQSRFKDLYVAELSMVESEEVETAMVGLRELIVPDWKELTEAQRAALKLSHALRDSLVKSWGVDEGIVDNPR